ncbi:hypothetical protein K6U51_11960 [Vibrio fluvialis]|uniref:hypothetical protein n=1 Tax=Vibrio fluvialis TaxID=676 RepID=UPI001EEC9C63|nr:hypothetical protein [Vibrio fluvialis]MCG6387526.1 hypothetical protein [Vibrio fluvialis]MCG6418750.1 hypothetical protein [Vibrio fluvialis]
MKWKTENHVARPSKTAQIVEYQCTKCKQGFMHVDATLERDDAHHQIPHRCTACGHIAYLACPYPLVAVNGQRFVHWDTIRGY